MSRWLFTLPLVVCAQLCFGTVRITTTKLPNGTVGTEYSAAITASGGCMPYQWAIDSGSLPAGVTAQKSSTTSSLKLTGIPKTAATYSFTVQVKGCGGHIARVTYKVVTQASANHVVNLDWTASSSKDAVGYNVYRAPDGVTWNRINPSLIASTLYSDSSVSNGSTYYYAATAVDVYGHESSKTAAVKVVIP